VSFWFNFGCAHINNAWVADASEYMRDAIALGRFLCHEPGFYFSYSPELKAALAELRGFSQSGIVFPGYILLAWLVSASPHATTSWQAPVFGQCLLAAFACVFVSLTAELIWNRRTGMICGVLSALYPAYIVNSGRLYSESFATSIVAVVLFSFVRGLVGKPRGRAEMFFMGVNLAMLQLTRSLMIVMSVSAFPLTFIQEGGRRSLKKLAFLVTGMAVILVPWLCMQKAVFDKASLVVDRVGNYNLYVGTNYSIKGWLSYPYPDVSSIEKKSAPAVLYDNVRSGPLKSLKLLADKPYRLFKFPWNDFRTAIGPISFYWQVAFHQLLLLLCAIGLCLCLFDNSDGKPAGRAIVSARLFLVVYLFFHLLYLLFITVPRYNMTAAPVLLLFAGAGAARLFELTVQDGKRGLLLIVASVVLFFGARTSDLGIILRFTENAFAAAFILAAFKLLLSILFFLVLYKTFRFAEKPVPSRASLWVIAFCVSLLLAYPARANGRPFEWQCELRAGDKIIQEITVAKVEALNNRQVYLLLDSEGVCGLMESGAVSINGIAISSPPVPGISLTQDFAAVKTDPSTNTLYLECEWIYDCMTEPAAMANSDLRQWFWLPVPPAAVQSIVEAGVAKVCVENKNFLNPAKLFGVYIPNIPNMPSKPKKQSATVGSLDTSSWEKSFYAVESDRTLTDPRYDLSVDFSNRKAAILIGKDNKERGASPAPGPPAGSLCALLVASAELKKAAAPKLALPLPKMLTVEAGSIKKHQTRLLAGDSIAQSEIWLIRLKGRSSSLGDRACVKPSINVLVGKQDGSHVTYPCRWMPRELPAAESPLCFDYCFPLMPSLLPGKISAFDVSFEALQNRGDLKIDDCALEILTLPANPLVHRQSVF